MAYYYIRNKISDFLSIKSLISACRAKFANETAAGEAHDFPEFVYIVKGNHNVSIDGKLFELTEGQLVMYSPGAFHECIYPTDALVYIVCFESDSEELCHLYNRIITLSSLQRQLLDNIILSAEKALFRPNIDTGARGMYMLKQGKAELYKLKAGLEFLLIDMYSNINVAEADVSEVARISCNKSQYEIIKSYLEANLDKTLTLENIATACSMSVSQVKKIFKKYNGDSPISFFISMKIDASKEMMTSTSMNFTEISQKLGFKSVYYFSRQFKRKTGDSPSEYCKSIQGRLPPHSKKSDNP